MPLSVGGGGGSGSGSGITSGNWNPITLLNKAAGLIRRMGWTGLGKAGFGTVFLGTILLGVSFIRALVMLPIRVINALTGDLIILNNALIAGPAQFFISGLQAAAGAFDAGWTGLLGPLQGPLAAAITLIMVWEVLYFLDIVNSDVIGIVLDLPIISSGEGSAEEGEEG